jgi:hypothetical protein
MSRDEATGTYDLVNDAFANAAKWDPRNVILGQMMQRAGLTDSSIGCR